MTENRVTENTFTHSLNECITRFIRLDAVNNGLPEYAFQALATNLIIIGCFVIQDDLNLDDSLLKILLLQHSMICKTRGSLDENDISYRYIAEAEANLVQAIGATYVKVILVTSDLENTDSVEVTIKEDHVEEILRSIGKVRAIKVYRTAFKCGLKEAKLAVEYFMRRKEWMHNLNVLQKAVSRRPACTEVSRMTAVKDFEGKIMAIDVEYTERESGDKHVKRISAI